jgi:hypothetical protein
VVNAHARATVDAVDSPEDSLRICDYQDGITFMSRRA